MTRSPVKSSNLKSVGYDPATKTLEVEFHSGAVHQFKGVGSGHHQNLIKAKSPGSYFHAHIKENFRSSEA